MFWGLFPFVGHAQAVQIRQTDSSRIEIRQYPAGREERETLRRQDRVYWRFYRHNTAQVTTTGLFTKAGRSIGRWTDYDDQGRLQYVVDRDRGTWRVAQPDAYPYLALQRRMQAKADSVVVATYGRQFLQQHAVWNPQGFAIYNARESGSWTDRLTAPPTKFLFRYDVKLDAQHVYPDLIEFELDTQGRFLPNSSEEVFGFEQRLPWASKKFALRYGAALKVVARLSGARSQSLTGGLYWEGWRQEHFYNGHFRFYVPVPTGLDKDLHPEGRSTITKHFDVYSFDPWTGALLGKKKMKTVDGWEARSGSSSGLLSE